MKSTSLIILSTKHLHNSFCIDFDAFWWLRTKCAIFARKIVNFSLFHKIKTNSLKISHIKHLHSSFCVHFDAFWRIFSHSEHLEQNVENSIFLSKLTKFFSMSSECINMQQNVSKCFQNEFCKCFVHKMIKKVIFITFRWAKMHQYPSKCIKMCQNVCSMNYSDVLCMKFQFEKFPFFDRKWTIFIFKCSDCINTHQNASKCMQNKLC